jgi:hypothetical protein
MVSFLVKMINRSEVREIMHNISYNIFGNFCLLPQNGTLKKNLM